MAYSNEDGEALASRRRSPRVEGSFDARRVDAASAHLRVTNLSVGGCLIESLHDEKVGRRFRLEIDLPLEGWISVEAETIYLPRPHEMAVKFVEMSDETRSKIHRVVRRILADRRKKRA